MSDRPKRAPLGRGLAALFGEGGARVLAGPGTPRAVPIEAIRPSPFQPRRRFAEAELDALVDSIREKGVIQPLLVRPIGDAGGEPGADFELVAGERRWPARSCAAVSMSEPPSYWCAVGPPGPKRGNGVRATPTRWHSSAKSAPRSDYA